MASHAPRSASSSIGIIATQTWRMQSLKRGVIRAQVDRWSGFASTGATMSWLGRSASFSLTRAERRRSRGDDKRGDFAESPEPGGRQGWQIAGQIEMPRPPNPIMKRSRRPRPPNHRRLSACIAIMSSEGAKQPVPEKSVTAKLVSACIFVSHTAGLSLASGVRKGPATNHTGGSRSARPNRRNPPIADLRPRHDRTLRFGRAGTAARPSPRCARRGLRRRSSPKDK